jgi:hypothetical protein
VNSKICWDKVVQNDLEEFRLTLIAEKYSTAAMKQFSEAVLCSTFAPDGDRQG